MKSTFTSLLPRKFFPFRRSGFSLVATVILMVLLGLLALAMLSLSAISSRSSQRMLAESAARANARMALQLAIGQLQKAAGPDQRVTAVSNILPDTTAGKKHWTGVWDSGAWRPGRPDDKTFLSWLVSDPEMIFSESGSQSFRDKVKSPTSGEETILVGPGTLGNSSPDEEVKVPSFGFQGRGGSGRLAWWVGDEGVKARYDLEETQPVSAFAESLPWSAPTSLGMQKMQGLGNYPSTKEKRGGILSYPSVKLLSPGMPGNLFHHVTTDSEGLPVDVRQGGTKRDLSLAFELPLEEFNTLVDRLGNDEFHNGKEYNGTDGYDYFNSSLYNRPEFYPGAHRLGYLFQIPFHANAATPSASNPDRLRGPTWDLLRNHYRLYKKDWESFDWPRKQPVSATAVEARGSLPLSYSTTMDGGANTRFMNRANEGSMFHKVMRDNNYSKINYSRMTSHSEQFRYSTAGDMIRRTAEKIAPVITRVTWVFGLMSGGQPGNETVSVAISPYFTFWNPYDQPIAFHSLGLRATRFRAFQFRITYTDKDGNEQSPGITFNAQSTYNYGSMSMRLDPVQNGNVINMKPGEIMVACPHEIPGGLGHNRYVAVSKLPATLLYNEKPSWMLGSFQPAPNSTVKLKVTGRPSGDTNQGDSFVFSMFYPKMHAGQTRNVVTDVISAGNSTHADRDLDDDPFLFRLCYSTFPGPSGLLEIERSMNMSQIPPLGKGAQFVGAFDMWMKDFHSQGVSVLSQYNPRATTVDPRDHDGSYRVNPMWEARLLRMDDISLLNLMSDAGLGRWGGGLENSPNSPSYLVQYAIPRAPLTSLSSLQHADIGSLATDANYAIGNSFPPPAIPKNGISGRLGFKSTYYVYNHWGPQPQFDLSWAANEAIWDRYFFSGINWGDDGNRHQTLAQAAAAARTGQAENSPFANPRVHLIAPPDTDGPLMKYDTIASHLAVKGAFNINSTSVEAWKAVLAGLDGKELSYENGKKKSFDSPVSRFGSPQGDDEDKYRGFRSLSDAQIGALAEKIVDQVRQRGPFMGLADFVNRRLDTGDFGNGGALQAAIDQTNINQSVRSSPDNTITPNAIDSTQAGLPGYLTQADVLTASGGSITARSDTFKIRAYGEARDAAGNLTARAWCEAVIQRMPDWITPTDEEPTMPNENYPANLDNGSDLLFHPHKPNPAFPSTNLTFGRRMSVTSFRWLSPEEV